MPSRYTDQTLLRRSHFGDLYRATDSESGAEVVLRRLIDSETAAAEPAQVDAIARRAARLSRLQNAHVASVLGADVDGDGAFVINEWVEGGDLTSIVSQAALTVDDFSTIVRHSLDGLRAIHDEGLVHGSLKPNRFVLQWQTDQSLLFVITDLGLAELLGSADVVTTDSRGNYNGAVDCLAPELFDGAPGDVRSDLYSLGNVLYYALTQNLPFHGDSADDTIARHRAGNAPPVLNYRQELSAPLCDWLMSLINRDPADRPASAASALAAFEAALDPAASGTAAPAIPDEVTEAQPDFVDETPPDLDAKWVADPVDIPASDAAEPAPEPALPVAATPETAKVTVSADSFAKTAPESSPLTDSRKTPRKALGGWLPAIVGGVLAIVLGAFAWVKLTAPSGEDTLASDSTTTSGIGSPATAAPLPGGEAGDPAPEATDPTSAVGGKLPVTDALLARFAFDNIADGPPQPGISAAPVSEWPKQQGIDAIGALQALGVDDTIGSSVRKVIATPEMFPALNRAHTLVQITGEASLKVQWLRDGEPFLPGDQLTCIAVFWTPEKNATVFRLEPPRVEEANITTRVQDGQLGSNIFFHGKDYPAIPYPFGNQFLGVTLAWTGSQDNARQSILTASGERFDSRLSAAPNLALLASSLQIGGETGAYVENVPCGIYFAEALLYDRALTQQERAQLDAYLNAKYFR